jgi:hypothetical protein
MNYSTLWIVGEVYNGSSNYLKTVTVNVSLFNSSGQLVDLDVGWVEGYSLSPWTKGCFQIMISNSPPFSWYEFHSLTYEDDADPSPNLTLYNHFGSYDSIWGNYKILGQMRNDDSVFVNFAKAIATLYNLQGQVVACDYGYGADYTLDPGQVTLFEIESRMRDYADVTSYTLVSDGWK